MKKAIYYIAPFVVFPLLFLLINTLDKMGTNTDTWQALTLILFFMFSALMGTMTPTEKKFDYLMTLLKMINGGDINIINGPDEMLLCGLSMGADGGIGSTYNVMPERFAALYKAFRAGDIDRAREIQFGINRVIRVILEFGSGAVLANVKDAVRLMGFDAGVCAYPMACADAAGLAEMKRRLIEAGLEL